MELKFLEGLKMLEKGNYTLEFNNNWEIRENRGTTIDKNGKETDQKVIVGSYASITPALKRFGDLTGSEKDLKSYCEHIESIVNESKHLRVEIIKEVPVMDLKLILQDKGLTKEQINVIENRVSKFEEINNANNKNF